MTEFPANTESLCPHCFRRVSALRTDENESVYLKKSCPEHGNLEEVLIWKNNPRPYDQWSRPGSSRNSPPFTSDGCPDNCGICPDHRQSTCSAILEVTRRCDLRCPVCFAASEADAGADPDLNLIEKMLQTAFQRTGSCPLQLSGGEPTLRNDLPQIIGLARKIGFDHIQVNTNGIRLAEDSAYGQALKDAGVTDFYLQFDGLTDHVYRRIRGAELLKHKLKAIERCTELKIGVILVPTLVRGVNEDQIGSIIQFAKKRMPAVKGVHFQPMTYLGRYPGSPRNEERILIPDILAAIEEQTGGELKQENFVPPG
jgi:7,8-dihydro-6-hydroxymethylpterin dimethyltransferase